MPQGWQIEQRKLDRRAAAVKQDVGRGFVNIADAQGAQMGEFVATRGQRIFGWAATAVMGLAVAAMILL